MFGGDQGEALASLVTLATIQSQNPSPFLTTKKYRVRILPTSNNPKNSLKSGLKCGLRMFGGDQGEALASLVVLATIQSQIQSPFFTTKKYLVTKPEGLSTSNDFRIGLESGLRMFGGD